MIKRLAFVVVVCALATMSIANPASTANAQTTAPNGNIEHASEPIPGQYIVRLRDTVAAPAELPSIAQSLVGKYSGRILHTFDTLHGFVAHLTEAEALALSADPSVEAVEEDGVVHTTTTQTPTPSWGLDRIDQLILPLDNSYSYQADGTGVTAYTIDTGILPTHVDFGGRASIGADFVGDGQSGIDCSGHGTHVAGTIGGTTYGVAKGVKIVAVRVLDCSGGGSFSNVIAGINWVIANRPSCMPAVVNMSLGGSPSSMANDAVEQAIGTGITFVVAAGNSNKDAANFSPASAPDALTIGATGKSDARSSFSNIGSVIDLFAPGEGITSDWINSNTGTRNLDGTSMATPHVTGAVARYLQIHPAASPADVANALKSTASPVVTNPGTGSPNLLLDASPSDSATPDPTACGEYHPLPPARILDTRGDLGVTCNTGLTKLGDSASFNVKVRGCNGVPTNGVSAVVLNATVDAPTANSFLTIWPSGSDRPVVSNLNYVTGQTVPNLVTVRLGPDGNVSVFNFSGSTHVILDVMGWYSALDGTAGGRFHPVTPARVIDTRFGIGAPASPIGPGATITGQMTGGISGVLPGATAIAINVTVTQPTASGFLTAYPGDLLTAPSVSSLNFAPALTVPNLAVVGLSAGGLVKFLNSNGFTHLVVDVVGYYDTIRTTEAGRFNALPPTRVLDTRTSAPLGPGATNVFTIAGKGGVPATGANAVVVNVTVTDPTADGFLTVFPGPSKPESSNLNFVAGQTVPNLVMVGLTGSNVSSYNLQGFTQVIYDVGGYFTSS